MTSARRLAAALLAALLQAAPAFAQQHLAALPGPQPVAAADTTHGPEPAHRLPADVTTKHVIALPGRTLHFTATVGSVTLSDAEGKAQAQVGFTAYTLDDQAPEQRPISFAMNGGPGSGSAWLQLGLLGPWRMRMNPELARPSADPIPVDNADTWLDFTDLVFIDPVGTGFSRLLVNNTDNRKKYWSVNGDVASIAEAIRKYLTDAKRMTSPKYIIGESYSGLRGPKLVRQLTSTESVGITGLVLISPKLDYGGRSTALDPLSWVAVLPSEVAAQRAAKAPVTRADLADVEAYAAGDYLADLLRGEDPAAVQRRVDAIAALTGLDRSLVLRRHGVVRTYEFLREREHAAGLVASPYDATVTKADPFPASVESSYPDPMTDSLQPAFVSAVVDIYTRRLGWLGDARYEISNTAVFHAWDFGNGYNRPESVSALRTALATDPDFHVLIAHGLFDVLTPYFETQLMLNQIPKSVGADRIDFEVYPGGHMFYSRDASRAAFREAAARMYEAK